MGRCLLLTPVDTQRFAAGAPGVGWLLVSAHRECRSMRIVAELFYRDSTVLLARPQ